MSSTASCIVAVLMVASSLIQAQEQKEETSNSSAAHATEHGLSTTPTALPSSQSATVPPGIKTHELRQFPGLWNRVLRQSTGGQYARDGLLEQLVRQTFTDSMSVIRDVVTNRNDHSGNETNAFKSYLSTLDPYHLWPISEKLEKKVFSADFEACDVHMHNLRSGKLIHVQVVRNPNLETIATRMVFHFPLLWMTGFYRLTKSLLFGMVPVKNRQGGFNIDINSVSVTVVAFLKASDEDLTIEEFDVDMQWKSMAFKFEKIAGRFSTLADFSMNQLGLGDLVVKKEKEKVISELTFSFQGIFYCALNRPGSGLDKCLRKWWEQRGWYLWERPVCDRS